MCTTSTSPLLAVEAMRAGATDYLIKPIAPDRLVAALEAPHLLDHRRIRIYEEGLRCSSRQGFKTHRTSAGIEVNE